MIRPTYILLCKISGLLNERCGQFYCSHNFSYLFSIPSERFCWYEAPINFLQPFSYHQLTGCCTFDRLDGSIIIFLGISKYIEFLMERHFYAIDPKRKLISVHSLLDKDFLLQGAPYLMECCAFPSIIYGLFHK